jgi:hypothetical protein
VGRLPIIDEIKIHVLRVGICDIGHEVIASGRAPA